MGKVCSIEGCGKPHEARGWCKSHYMCWRRNGDPLTCRTSKGEALRYFLDVVLAYDGDDCLPWPFGRDPQGYGRVKFDGRMQFVHRRVCEEVNGPPPTPKHEAAHNCGHGDQACCTKRHLSWKTPAQNQADRLIHDTHARGEYNGRAKLTEPEVRQIIALKGKKPQREIAELFDTSRVNVGAIHTGKSWAHLLPLPFPPELPRPTDRAASAQS